MDLCLAIKKKSPSNLFSIWTLSYSLARSRNTKTRFSNRESQSYPRRVALIMQIGEKEVEKMAQCQKQHRS